MQPIHLFRRCPACGERVQSGANPLHCPACGLSYFFNPTVAAAAYIFDAQQRALFIRRAKEPAKGLLAIPGGFIDIGESAEDALRREALEEVDVELADVRFLCSCPNEYPYRGVTYPVCDLIFTATAVNPDAVRAKSEVAGIEWRRLEDVTEAELAFPSLRMGLRRLRGEQ
jgi:ADP-ribose pyrophosphatase YjhB (NUDIX family)